MLTLCSALSLLSLLSGCSPEEPTSKKTLFDEDHYVPPHWPSDINDLAEKIATRVEAIGSSAADQAAAIAELKDLIMWAPEIAAETDLTEEQWNPLYQQSESLRAKLKRSSNELPAGLAQEIRDFHQEILQAIELLQAAETPPPVDFSSQDPA
ncbi:hypothetical protein SH139x_001772 [Planctomycetaceae bacterium SH139]